MFSTYGRMDSLARASLLVAALLYFLGGVADAGLHRHFGGASGVNAVSSPEHAPGDPAPDADRGCSLCAVLGAPVLPGAAAAIPVALGASAAAPSGRPSAEPAPRATTARARAPPVSILL